MAEQHAEGEAAADDHLLDVQDRCVDGSERREQRGRDAGTVLSAHGDEDGRSVGGGWGMAASGYWPGLRCRLAAPGVGRRESVPGRRGQRYQRLLPGSDLGGCDGAALVERGHAHDREQPSGTYEHRVGPLGQARGQAGTVEAALPAPGSAARPARRSVARRQGRRAARWPRAATRRGRGLPRRGTATGWDARAPRPRARPPRVCRRRRRRTAPVRSGAPTAIATSPASRAAALTSGGPGRPRVSPGTGSTTRSPATPRPRSRARAVTTSIGSSSRPTARCGRSQQPRTASAVWSGLTRPESVALPHATRVAARSGGMGTVLIASRVGSPG